jgi:type VI secretion system secreted protein VgrG
MAWTQKNRICSVSSPFGDDVLLIERLHATEALSSLFRYQLELLSEDDDLGFEQIVGKPLTVSVRLENGKQRHFHGVVSRFAQGKSRGRFSRYTAEVVPALWLLTRRVNCRIFQHLSVPDIAKKLFGELGVTDVKWDLQKSYKEREYCVQFRESDFNFVSRLLEDVGISYYFMHDAKSHTLVLFDSPGGNHPCPGQETAIYAAASAEGVAADVTDFSVQRELRPGKFSHTDYNFEQPSLSLQTTTPTSLAIGGNDRFEIYEHSGDFMDPGLGESRVKLRMEAEESASVEARGESRCASFLPGYRFDLRGHHRKAANEAWVITEVSHSITDSITPEQQDAKYENAFVCRPHRIPIRPLRTTPKPTIPGVQTATVTGAPGKEIDIDSHARVVVQFHWDREGKRDQNSSCRVRVAQNSAGKGWGLMANPRIGQEVVVEFIDGDPDRPLVIGMVYNGEQPPPFGSDTQTGFRTRSSPGGGGFNEIRMDDKKGAEELFINSQYNTNIATGNNKDEKVKVDESASVGGSRTRNVGKDESVTIGVNRKKKVGGKEEVEIGADRTKKVAANESSTIGANYEQKVGADRTRSVSGMETITIALARMKNIGLAEMVTIGALQEINVGATRSLSVALSQNTSIGTGYTLSVGGAQNVTIGKSNTVAVTGSEKVTVGGGQAVEVGGDRTVNVKGKMTEAVTADLGLSAKAVTIEAKEQIKITNGKASITLSSGGDVTIEGKLITIDASGNLVLKGEKILQN